VIGRRDHAQDLLAPRALRLPERLRRVRPEPIEESDQTARLLHHADHHADPIRVFEDRALELDHPVRILAVLELRDDPLVQARRLVVFPLRRVSLREPDREFHISVRRDLPEHLDRVVGASDLGVHHHEVALRLAHQLSPISDCAGRIAARIINHLQELVHRLVMLAHVVVAPPLLVDREPIRPGRGEVFDLAVHAKSLVHAARVEVELRDVQERVRHERTVRGLPDDPRKIRIRVRGSIHLHQREPEVVQDRVQRGVLRIAVHDAPIGRDRLLLPERPLLHQGFLIRLDRGHAGFIAGLLGRLQPREHLVAIRLVEETLRLVPVEFREARQILRLGRVIIVGGLDQLIQRRDRGLEFLVRNRFRPGDDGFHPHRRRRFPFLAGRRRSGQLVRLDLPGTPRGLVGLGRRERRDPHPEPENDPTSPSHETLRT